MEFIQQNLLLVILALVSGGLLFAPNFRRSGQEVTPTEATMMINRENGLVVDVRPADDFAAGHIPEARNIPVDAIADRAGELEKFKARPIIVNCQTGVRASRACGELRKLGFEKVFNLAGGIGAWQQAGLPLKKGAK